MDNNITSKFEPINNRISKSHNPNKTILKESFGESNCTQNSSDLSCSVGGLDTYVDEYGNVTSTAIITVPRGCCFGLAVRYVDATVTDPTVTPTPSINVQNANLVINRIA